MYGRFYRWRSGWQAGSGTSNTFWNMQHPERAEQGTGICPARNVPGKHGPGISQENNITKNIYTRESSGYRVAATEVPSAHCDGVAVLYRAA